MPASTPNENSKEPDAAMLIIIHVGFGPADSKQPAFNVPTELSGPGLVEGFENELVVSSITLPAPFGVISKACSAQILIASTQSGWEKDEKHQKNKRKNVE